MIQWMNKPPLPSRLLVAGLRSKRVEGHWKTAGLKCGLPWLNVQSKFALCFLKQSLTWNLYTHWLLAPCPLFTMCEIKSCLIAIDKQGSLGYLESLCPLVVLFIPWSYILSCAGKQPHCLDTSELSVQKTFIKIISRLIEFQPSRRKSICALVFASTWKQSAIHCSSMDLVLFERLLQICALLDDMCSLYSKRFFSRW